MITEMHPLEARLLGRVGTPTMPVSRSITRTMIASPTVSTLVSKSLDSLWTGLKRLL